MCCESLILPTFSERLREKKNLILLMKLIFTVSTTFLPRINKAILEFQESWNHHALSSEGNKSPFQLFFEGIQHEANSSQVIPSDIDVSELTGNHEFAPCSLLEENLHNIAPTSVMF